MGTPLEGGTRLKSIDDVFFLNCRVVAGDEKLLEFFFYNRDVVNLYDQSPMQMNEPYVESENLRM